MISLTQNAVVFLSVFLYCLSFCSISLAAPAGIAVKVNDKSYIMVIFLQSTPIHISHDGGTSKTEGKHRVRRQTGAGKFVDAAQMPQSKMLHLFLQMIKNMVADKNIGGAHPMDPDAVKPLMQVFNQRFMPFFFPDVGDAKKSE